MHQLFGSMGMSAVVFAKLAIVLLTAALCLAASARGGRGVWAVVGGLPLAVGIAGGLIGGITNTATFLALTATAATAARPERLFGLTRIRYT